jgi:hypothetical protein
MHQVLYAAWKRHFLAIASKPYNVIAAHNMFDVRYTEYHTGITPIYLYALGLLRIRRSLSVSGWSVGCGRPSLCAYAEPIQYDPISEVRRPRTAR